MSAQKGSSAAVVPPVPVIEDSLFLKSTDPSSMEGWFVSASRLSCANNDKTKGEG